MPADKVVVLTISASKSLPDPIDVRDILGAVSSPDWVWNVSGLDWLGEQEEILANRVDSAGAQGIWLSSDELRQRASTVYQTVEGRFVAFSAEAADKLKGLIVDLADFPTSEAQLAIIAVDGCMFDVYVKKPDHVLALKKLGAEVQDNQLYFAPYCRS